MKINGVQLFSYISPGSETLIANLPFRDPTAEAPYIVKTIIGLDADEISAQLYASNGNVNFYNMAMAQREVVIRLGLNPKNSNASTFGGLRDAMYKAISANRTGLISVKFTDNGVVQTSIQGHIAKLEASHFEENPEVQLTITCRNPIMRGEELVSIVDPSSIDVTDDISTAPHGFAATFVSTGNSTYFSMGQGDPGDPDWRFAVTPSPTWGGIRGAGTAFREDDIINLNSDPGSLLLTVDFITEGFTRGAMQHVVQGSVWPIFYPGENEFFISSGFTISSISYKPAFWGI